MGLGLGLGLVVLVVVGFVLAGWVRPNRRWPRLTMSARMAPFVPEGILKASSRFLKEDASSRDKREVLGRVLDGTAEGRQRGSGRTS